MTTLRTRGYNFRLTFSALMVFATGRSVSYAPEDEYRLPVLSEFLNSIEGDPDDHKQDGESRKPFTGWPRGSKPTFHAYRSGCYLMGSIPMVR